MPTYNLLNNVTLNTSYSGNNIAKAGNSNHVLRPYNEGAAWYLRVYEVSTESWLEEYFTGGDMLNVVNRTLTIGMSLLTKNGGLATLTVSDSSGAFSLLAGDWTLNANLTSSVSTPGTLLIVPAGYAGYTLTFKGNVTSTNRTAISISNVACSVIIEGNVTGGASMVSGVSANMPSGLLRIKGNVIGGSGGMMSPTMGPVGVNFLAGQLIIEGSVTANGSPGVLYNISSGLMTIEGDVIGSAANFGVLSLTHRPWTVKGNIRGSDYPGVSGRLTGLTWNGYFEIPRGGTGYKLQPGGGASGRLCRSLYQR